VSLRPARVLNLYGDLPTGSGGINKLGGGIQRVTGASIWSSQEVTQRETLYVADGSFCTLRMVLAACSNRFSRSSTPVNCVRPLTHAPLAILNA